MAKRAIIPNTFTLTNMVLGFLAILIASSGTPDGVGIAGILVFTAAFFDFFDGAAARALKVVSPIGEQLDSLADSVAYGIAPGVIAYYAYLKELPEIGYGMNWGMVIAPIFPICAVYRLARFNIGEEEGGFSGLPSPPAGIVIASIPSLFISKNPFFGDLSYKMPLEIFVPMFIIIALMMVSTVDYKKTFNLLVAKGKKVTILTIIVVAMLIFTFHMWATFIVCVLYIIFGILIYIKNLITGKE